MEKEMTFLDELQVYVWVLRDEVPPGTKIDWTDWVLKQKGDEVRARLVVCSVRVGGKKLVENFAPTPSPLGLRCLFFYGVKLRLDFRTADLSVAFMHGPLERDHYSFPPPGYSRPGYVWKLLKAMNGIQSAMKDYLGFLTGVMIDRMKFTTSTGEPTLFIHAHSSLRMTVYVDDPLAAGHDAEILSCFEEMRHYVLLKSGEKIVMYKVVKYVGRIYERTEYGLRVAHTLAISIS